MGDGGGGVASSERLVFLWDKWGRGEGNNYLDLVGDGGGVASSELFIIIIIFGGWAKWGRAREQLHSTYLAGDGGFCKL